MVLGLAQQFAKTSDQMQVLPLSRINRHASGIGIGTTLHYVLD